MDVMMLKLNRRLRRLFHALPGGTLSVVLLAGGSRYPPVRGEQLLTAGAALNPPLPPPSAHSPGLCLLEVKQDP